MKKNLIVDMKNNTKFMLLKYLLEEKVFNIEDVYEKLKNEYSLSYIDKFVSEMMGAGMLILDEYDLSDFNINKLYYVFDIDNFTDFEECDDLLDNLSEKEIMELRRLVINYQPYPFIGPEAKDFTKILWDMMILNYKEITYSGLSALYVNFDYGFILRSINVLVAHGVFKIKENNETDFDNIFTVDIKSIPPILLCMMMANMPTYHSNIKKTYMYAIEHLNDNSIIDISIIDRLYKNK